jgi:hypothetical protein
MDDRPTQESQPPASESETPAHGPLSRRSFLQAGAASAIALGLSPMDAIADSPATRSQAETMMNVPSKRRSRGLASLVSEAAVQACWKICWQPTRRCGLSATSSRIRQSMPNS